MSRIGKLPINIPDSITVIIKGKSVTCDNGKIKEVYQLSSGIAAEVLNKQIKIFATDPSPDASMFSGMDRSNIKNIITGLQTPFKVTLEVNGVGYKAFVDKEVLVLTLGCSHEVLYVLPKGVSAVFEKPNLIIISGQNKILVGQVASEIILFRKSEPYKGKGIKVFGKKILRKEGKKK